VPVTPFLAAAATILGIAAEGLAFGWLADWLLARWHPERGPSA
jgi:hypothetical protein